MVLPGEVGDAAEDCDSARVLAWLDAGGDVNDVDQDGYTLIHCCAMGDPDSEGEIFDGHVSLARTLIALGADVNLGDSSHCRNTPLQTALKNAGRGGAWLDMIKLLLNAKANPNARDSLNDTPLASALRIDRFATFDPPLGRGQGPISPQTSGSLIALRVLLRAGASLDVNETAPYGLRTAEGIVRHHYDQHDSRGTYVGDSDKEYVVAIKSLVAGVRQHGTYKRHMRAPHRDVLAVRGLAQRGKLRTDHPVLAFLAKQGDNGVCWHILTYWRATD